MTNKEIPEDISRKLRASYYFMGALLSKYKKVYEVSGNWIEIEITQDDTIEKIVNKYYNVFSKENQKTIIIAILSINLCNPFVTCSSKYADIRYICRLIIINHLCQTLWQFYIYYYFSLSMCEAINFPMIASIKIET
jgi:hypothetical protein